MKVKVDKLVVIHVLKKERDMVDGIVSIGLSGPFEDEVRAFSPSSSLDDAMEAADAIGLFQNGYALHYLNGAYDQIWKWYVSQQDDRGILQGYVSAGTPAMAVTLACLKQVGVDIEGLPKHPDGW